MIVVSVLIYLSMRFIILWILSVYCLVLCGCRSVKYVPVETVKHDSVLVQKHVRDSILLRDSVIVERKGDTVYLRSVKYEYRYRYLRDTAYVSRTDSVQVPYPVEKPLTRWQQTKMDIGGIGLLIAAVALLALIVWIAVRFRRK